MYAMSEGLVFTKKFFFQVKKLKNKTERQNNICRIFKSFISGYAFEHDPKFLTFSFL